MNLLRVAFTAATASHKTFGRHMLRSGMIRGFATGASNLESEQVVSKMNRRGDLINDEEELSRTVVKVLDRRLIPNEKTYTSLIFSLCVHNRYDDAYRVLNEMFVSGFSPSLVTWKNVFGGFLRIGDIRKVFEMRTKIHIHFGWKDDATEYWLSECMWDNKVTFTSLLNAYLDEGNWDYAKELLDVYSDPCDDLLRVIINELDNKTRTTEINNHLKKHLLRFFYDNCLDWPFLEYYSTMVQNSSYDEFVSLVDLANRFCKRGLEENAYHTMLKSKYKPDGIDDGLVYNLFVIAHCKRSNIDEAYNMYKEMAHYGFACHMFTMFILIKTLSKIEWGVKELSKDVLDKLLWVIQNVLSRCNLNDSEIANYLNEFNTDKPISEALFDVMAEKANDGLFLKCSYAPPSA